MTYPRIAMRRQRGAVGVMTPMLMISILSVGALAIDVGRLVTVRNELQNAADAAALAGAAGLFPGSTPQWATATTKANNAIPLNETTGTALSTGTVQTGYWNLSGTPATLQAQTITPTANDAPAVQVTVSRTAATNGVIPTLLAQLFGGNASIASATAVAVVAPPGGVTAGATPLPMVISSCLYSQFFNTSTGQPDTTKQLYIGSSYHYGACESGQWTSYFSSSNSDSTTKNLIDGTTQSPAMNIGDNIWVQTGTKTNLFDVIGSQLVGKTVLIPVVNDPTGTGFTTNGQMQISAFAAFYIESASGGSTKAVVGHFVGGYKIPGGTGVGPYYGAYVPPRLAQ